MHTFTVMSQIRFQGQLVSVLSKMKVTACATAVSLKQLAIKTKLPLLKTLKIALPLPDFF